MPVTKDIQIYGGGKALSNMAWRVKNCVPNGNRLQDHEALSLAQISLATGLNPFTGELWYIPGKGPMAGIRGLRRRAKEQSTYTIDPRAMRDEERREHDLKDGDIGRICALFRHDVLARAVEINKAAEKDVVPIKPVIGIGIWRRGDQVPSGKSPVWVADKRAEADALRKAFDLTELPYSDEINGAELVADAEDAEWNVSAADEDETILREVAMNGETVQEELAIKWPTRPWDAETLGRAMVAKVAAYRGKSTSPSDDQLNYCRSSLGKLKLSDPDRHTLTLYLFDKESTSELTAAECSALIDWIGAKAETDWEPSQDAKVEVRTVIKQYQLEAGQQEMALEEAA
jgi:hypothetical protein